MRAYDRQSATAPIYHHFLALRLRDHPHFISRYFAAFLRPRLDTHSGQPNPATCYTTIASGSYLRRIKTYIMTTISKIYSLFHIFWDFILHGGSFIHK